MFTGEKFEATNSKNIITYKFTYTHTYVRGDPYTQYTHSIVLH